MYQTLFHIPAQIGGYRVFGFGILLAVWAVASVALLVWLGYRQGLRNPDTMNYVTLLLLMGAIIWLILPRILEPPPPDGVSPGLAIRGYGVMLLLGILAGTGLSVWRGRQLGLNPDKVLTLVFWTIVPGIIMTRAFFVVQYWPEFRRETAWETLGAVVNVTQGGVVVYGALVGALLGISAFAIKERWPVLASMDLLAPGMLLGVCLGRVGCFLNGCCFGGACDLPWAVEFPAGTPPYVHQVEHGDLLLQGIRISGEPSDPAVITSVESGSPADAQGLAAGQTVAKIDGQPVADVSSANKVLLNAAQVDPRVSMLIAGSDRPAQWPAVPAPSSSSRIHPTQIYSSIDALILCLFLLAYDPFRRRDGELVALLLTLYPINRFLMEIIRTDEAKVWITHLTIGQVVSIVLLILATGIWVYILRQRPGKAFYPETAGGIPLQRAGAAA